MYKNVLWNENSYSNVLFIRSEQGQEEVVSSCLAAGLKIQKVIIQVLVGPRATWSQTYRTGSRGFGQQVPSNFGQRMEWCNTNMNMRTHIWVLGAVSRKYSGVGNSMVSGASTWLWAFEPVEQIGLLLKVLNCHPRWLPTPVIKISIPTLSHVTFQCLPAE